jgi:hypothetical protein
MSTRVSPISLYPGSSRLKGEWGGGGRKIHNAGLIRLFFPLKKINWVKILIRFGRTYSMMKIKRTVVTICVMIG